jgi:homocysteine S-methyltransferase
MNRQEFRKILREKPLLLDGAMGTVLHSRGTPIDECFDALNIRRPAVVAEVHREYIDAGANIIETNSFGANPFKLAAHGLEAQVAAINSAAVVIARRVIAGSFQPIWLAGSVGPLGVRVAPLGRVSSGQAQAAFAAQMAALVQPTGGERGVDLLIIETLIDLEEAKAAVAAARQVAPDLPLVVQMSFTRDDRTPLGDSPVRVAQTLAGLDVDVIGANCSGGPAQILRLLGIMHQVAPHMLLSAVPNAGWPEQTEGGRVLYPATPAYFADYAGTFVAGGAALVGGCCGTNAAHIAAMRTALDAPIRATRSLPAIEVVQEEPGRALDSAPPTRLAQALQAGRFVTTVELRPPKGVEAQRMLAGAQMLKEAGANFLDIADSPLARMRMSAWAAAYLVQEKVGLEAILHFPTRGRNLLRVQGDLLAAHALGVRNLFVVMGDPTHIGDYPEAMDNYDIVPSGLIRLIKERLNSGVEQSGRLMDQATNFVVGCALSLQPNDQDRELRLLARKIRNGADFALTQPVFQSDAARAFLDTCVQEFGTDMIPVIAGIQPLYNSKNAEFLHHEVPGLTIPEAYRQRMKRAEHPAAEGVEIAQELLLAIQPVVQGVYLIPQFGRYNLAADVLDVLHAG